MGVFVTPSQVWEVVPGCLLLPRLEWLVTVIWFCFNLVFFPPKCHTFQKHPLRRPMRLPFEIFWRRVSSMPWSTTYCVSWQWWCGSQHSRRRWGVDKSSYTQLSGFFLSFSRSWLHSFGWSDRFASFVLVVWPLRPFQSTQNRSVHNRGLLRWLLNSGVDSVSTGRCNRPQHPAYHRVWILLHFSNVFVLDSHPPSVSWSDSYLSWSARETGLSLGTNHEQDWPLLSPSRLPLPMLLY